MEREQEKISKLMQEFSDLHNFSDLAFIKFYEKNKILIDSIDINKSDDNYNTRLRFLSEYGISLTGSGNYRKSVEILGQAIPLYENAPNPECEQFKEIPYVEKLLWNYGYALHQINQTKKSIEIFKRLNNLYPENDLYRNWYFGLKAINLSKIIKPMWIICFFWILGEVTFFEKFDRAIRFKLATIGVILYLSVALFQLYIYLTKKGKLVKPN